VLFVASVATELLGLVVVEVELLGLVLELVVSALAVVLELLGVVDDVEELGLVELEDVLG